MEIRVTELNASDEVTIRTRNSDYCFRMINPLECRGVLSGGRLDRAYEAVFVEIVGPTNRPKRISNQLKPGDRAVFIFGNCDRAKKLTTSAITAIVVPETHSNAADD